MDCKNVPTVALPPPLSPNLTEAFLLLFHYDQVDDPAEHWDNFSSDNNSIKPQQLSKPGAEIHATPQALTSSRLSHRH